MTKRNEFRVARRVESDYGRRINRLLTEEFVEPYTKLTTLSELQQFEVDPDVLSDRSLPLIETMLGEVNVANARSWRAAAARAARGPQVGSALQRDLDGYVGRVVSGIVARNRTLISTVPQNVAGRISKYIQRHALEGVRAESLVKAVHQIAPKLTTAQTQLIARTETAKTQSALTEARSQKLGILWYQWQTSEDSRVRASHRFMDQVLVAFAAPPAPEQLIDEPSKLGHYNAGECPNCRCTPLPVVMLDEINWPARVHTGGTVHQMTRAQFINYSGVERAA